MPELPEVETIKNELQPHILDRTISDVRLLWGGGVKEPSPEEFRRGLTGRRIVGVGRRGKYLILRLDNGWSWIAHMGMTGSLLVLPASEEAGKFVRVLVYLDDSQVIHFRDQRKFGKMWLVEDENKVVGKLGDEPLEEGFSTRRLAQRLETHSTAIKTLLLDQKVIAGVGNMYADEALFRARIDPRRAARDLSRAEVKRLHAAIQSVLKMGIEHNGASVDTYIRPKGNLGTAQTQFLVAHNKGGKCPVCGGSVERITLHQRGTFFCPKCQH